MIDKDVYHRLANSFGRELAELLLTYLEPMQGNVFKVSNITSFHFQRSKAAASKVKREALTKKRAQLSSRLYFFLKEMGKHVMGVEFLERTSGGSWFKFDRVNLCISLKELISIVRN